MHPVGGHGAKSHDNHNSPLEEVWSDTIAHNIYQKVQELRDVIRC